MFCPEGYVSLYDMGGVFVDLAYEWWEGGGEEIHALELNKARDTFVSEGGDVSNYIDLGPDINIPVSAYLCWAFDRLTIHHPNIFVAASPDGKIMRLGRYVLDSDRTYDGPFPQSLKEQKDLLEALEDGYFHIVRNYGTILPCADSDMIACFSLDSAVKALSAFEGWALCWKPPNFDNWQSELRTLLMDDTLSRRNLQHEATPRLKRMGRPRRSEGIVESAIQREFFKRLAAGKLPSEQREAALAEAVEWAIGIFDETIPRTTMQRYLRPVFEKMDAHK